ncbi:MAG: NAD(P)-dependent oxidoreductase [Candidatus Andersenbacteria bacterium]|nr:NAD(P)-dependent oxidoreductase [Candidatus Andersenbacteria bacterium]
MAVIKRVLVTGGAGYKGAVLVPKLLARGYEVTVVDWYMFGDDVLVSHPKLQQCKGDIRDTDLLKRVVPGHEAVIHLACISNDPSVALDARLSRSVNLDAFRPLVRLCKKSGVRRFIFASSASVYGVSDAPEVTEDHVHLPVTDYNRYKSLCERMLWEEQAGDFTVVVVRPATVCGCSPRLRLDLTVNILTNQAVNKGVITVFGGQQMRPNIHIDDITDVYVALLRAPAELVGGQAFNVGYENRTVANLAELVRNEVQRLVPERREISIETTSADDVRSYRISSEKIGKLLGFRPRCTIQDAVAQLVSAFRAGKVPEALTDPRYYNIQMMKARAAAIPV